MSNAGFFPLPNNITSHEWYTDASTIRLYMHLLVTANFEDTIWRGIVIKKGQRKTSLKELAIELGLSVQQIRSAQNNLISTSYLTINPTNKYTIYIIEKYEEIRETGLIPTRKPTNDSNIQGNTPPNKRATNNDQTPLFINNINNIKNKINTRARVDCDHDQFFDQFWQVVENKLAKRRAQSAFEKLKPDKAMTEKIIAAYQAQIAWRKKMHEGNHFVPEWPHPATWLNDKRWEDELTIPEVTKRENKEQPEWLKQRRETDRRYELAQRKLEELERKERENSGESGHDAEGSLRQKL